MNFVLLQKEFEVKNMRDVAGKKMGFWTVKERLLSKGKALDIHFNMILLCTM